MKDFWKILAVVIGIVTFVYIVSPIDACPGPIDDVIVLIVSTLLEVGITSLGMNKKQSEIID